MALLVISTSCEWNITPLKLCQVTYGPRLILNLRCQTSISTNKLNYTRDSIPLAKWIEFENKNDITWTCRHFCVDYKRFSTRFLTKRTRLCSILLLFWFVNSLQATWWYLLCCVKSLDVDVDVCVWNVSSVQTKRKNISTLLYAWDVYVEWSRCVVRWESEAHSRSRERRCHMQKYHK